jgi:hypothetical protein
VSRSYISIPPYIVRERCLISNRDSFTLLTVRRHTYVFRRTICNYAVCCALKHLNMKKCEGIRAKLHTFHADAAFTRYLFDRRLCGTSSLFGRGGEENKFLRLPEIEPWLSSP